MLMGTCRNPQADPYGRKLIGDKVRFGNGLAYIISCRIPLFRRLFQCLPTCVAQEQPGLERQDGYPEDRVSLGNRLT